MKKAFLIFLFLVTGLYLGLVAASDEPAMTRELDGVTVSYLYSNGVSYAVKFEETGASFRKLSGTPGEWVGEFPYKAFQVADNMYFLAWYEDIEGWGDYVTLLIDFNNGILYGSAFLKSENNTTSFHSARIVKVEGR